MTDYRRLWVVGGTYFFTVNLAERRENRLLVDNVALLRDLFRKVKLAHPFEINAIVVLPEHLFLKIRCLLEKPLPMSLR